MDVILDSNIFRSDITLRSKDLEILLDYLDKTDSSIIVPQIILDEITGLYKRALSERLVNYNKAVNNLNLTLPDSTKHLLISELDIEKETEKYVKFVKTKLKIKDKNILPYKNEYLPTIAARTISRKKPCGEDGQGFRDTIIWLTVVDYCDTVAIDDQVIFIGNNSNDFANKEKNGLHPDLLAECQEKSLIVNYYNTIKEFVEKHSVKISFITEEWLNDNVESGVAEELLEHELKRHDSYIVTSIKRKTTLDCTGHYEIGNVHLTHLDKFFVYEISDNELIVNVDAYFDVSIEYDYYDGPYDVQVSADVWEPQYWHARNSTDFSVVSYLTLKVVGKEITEIDIEDVNVE